MFGPAAIYFGNTHEFGTDYLRIQIFYILPVVLSLLIFIGLGMLVSARLFPVYLSLLFAVGILFWFQGSILVWDYGVFNGAGIDWSHYRWEGWIDVGVWISVLILAAIYCKKIIRLTSLASLLMIVVQSIFLLMILFSTPAVSSAKFITKQNIPEGLFHYSSNFNMIHVLFDGFQTEMFKEIVEEEKWQSDFDGFVLYLENMAAYGTTTFSYPAIFSGAVYEGDVELSSYVDEALQEKGFYNYLSGKGYTINFTAGITVPSKSFDNYYKVPAVYSNSRTDNEIRDAAYLMDVVLFRYFPHYLKKIVYNNQNWLIQKYFINIRLKKLGYYHHKDFFKEYIEKINISGENPTYHFVHLLPPHPPYTTDQDCDYAGKILNSTRDNFRTEGKCILKLFMEYLRRLKELGIYDSSLIILQADHGQGYPSGMMINSPHAEITPEVVGRSLALLVVKPPHGKGEMQISNKQTSIIDIYPTIMKTAGLESHVSGPSLFEVDPDKERERHFVLIEREDAGLMDYYKVTGSVFDYKSWKKVTRKDTGTHFPVKAYKWGDEIRFGILGNANSFQAAGWSAPEDGFTWIDGKKAFLRIPVTGTKSRVITLIANLRAFIYRGKIESQTVNVFVNGKSAGQWRITSNLFRDQTMRLPADLLDGSDDVMITFNTPDGVSPSSLNEGFRDGRTLSVAFSKIVLTE